MFELENGIPIPARVRAGKPEKYNFSSMSVGQSFFAPTGTSKNIVKTVTHAAYAAKKRIEKATGVKVKFTVTDAVEEGVSGARCWRAA